MKYISPFGLRKTYLLESHVILSCQLLAFLVDGKGIEWPGPGAGSGWSTWSRPSDTLSSGCGNKNKANCVYILSLGCSKSSKFSDNREYDQLLMCQVSRRALAGTHGANFPKKLKNRSYGKSTTTWDGIKVFKFFRWCKNFYGLNCNGTSGSGNKESIATLLLLKFYFTFYFWRNWLLTIYLLFKVTHARFTFFLLFENLVTFPALIGSSANEEIFLVFPTFQFCWEGRKS